VTELATYTDYIVILGATSDRHARAMADHLQRSLKDDKVKPVGVEGYETGQWILLDYGDVIIHVMHEQAREYYDLDGLWIDAERLEVEEAN
jgi:ribosome-associated protein